MDILKSPKRRIGASRLLRVNDNLNTRKIGIYMHEIPLKDLCVSINLDNRPKAGLYESTTKLSLHITKKSWSPIVFKGAIRLQKNFLFSDWAVLDYDGGQTTLEDAINTFCDCVHIIGTTKSHTGDHHRFRVCIPWETRISDLNKFRFNQDEFIKSHDTDAQCKDGARFYFPCKEIVSINSEGFRATVYEPPKENVQKAHNHSKTGFSSAVTFFMKNPIVQGNRNTQIYQVSKDLFRIGLDKHVVFQIILKAPTYRDMNVSPDLSREIEETMDSAWRSISNG